MTRSEILKNLLDMYRFTTPADPQRKKVILKSKKKVLINILKENGKYTFLMMLTISLFFSLKKTGFTISILKALVAAISATIIAAGGIAVAGIYTAKLITGNKTESASEEIIAEPSAKTEQVKEEPKNEPKQVVQLQPAKLVISLTTKEPTMKDLTEKVQKSLLSKIRGIKGNRFATIDTTIDAPYLISGSVVKLASSYTISLRLVNASDSSIISNIRESISSEDEIDSVTGSIASKLLNNIK